MLVNIDVPDIDAGVSFYTNGLGFSLIRTLFKQSVAEVALGQSTVYLIEQAEGTKPFPAASNPRTFERHWTPVTDASSIPGPMKRPAFGGSFLLTPLVPSRACVSRTARSGPGPATSAVRAPGPRSAGAGAEAAAEAAGR